MTATDRFDTAARLQACPIGIVPLGWPDPMADLDRFLSQIAELGFAGIQFADPGPDPAAMRDRFAAYDVEVAERYFPIPCTTDGPVATARTEGTEHLRQLRAMGGRMLVAAVDGSAERDRFTGHAERAPALTDAGWERLTALLDDLAHEAADAGVATTFHPHGGTFVESPEETERLLASTDPELVGLCLDTGHWLVGGGDPLEAVARFGGRVRHLHVKDADPDVVEGLHTGRVAGMSSAITDHIVFSPLGTGMLVLDELLDRLAAVGYRGWLMVEQDSFDGSAYDAAAHSRRVLGEALGRSG